MSVQDKICSDIYKNDLTSVEKYDITIDFGLDMCQIKVGIIQVNATSVWIMSDVNLLIHAYI